MASCLVTDQQAPTGGVWPVGNVIVYFRLEYERVTQPFEECEVPGVLIREGDLHLERGVIHRRPRNVSLGSGSARVQILLTGYIDPHDDRVEHRRESEGENRREGQAEGDRHGHVVEERVA